MRGVWSAAISSAFECGQAVGDGRGNPFLSVRIGVKRSLEEPESRVYVVDELRARARELTALERGGHVDAAHSGLAGGVEDRDVGTLPLAVEVVALGRRDERAGGAVGGRVLRVAVREQLGIVDDHDPRPR